MTEDSFVAPMSTGDLDGTTDALRRETPLHGLIGRRFAEQGPGCTVMTMELNETVRGSNHQPLHGGILATHSDVASAWALQGSYERSQGRPVTDMHIRYYRQPHSGPVTATATVVHKGSRLASVDCSITDAEERVLTRSPATFMIVPRVG